MKVASIKDVVDARAALKEHDLACTLHLHDACGAQTLSIELLEGANDETLADAQALLTDFFAERRLEIQFSETDGTIFYVMR